MAKMFFISDNHFTEYDGERSVIDIFYRPFKKSSDMNTHMIKMWNSVVSDNDTIFSVGDFAWNYEEFTKYSSKLNGNKYFIMGNHDLEGEKNNINVLFPLISFISYGGYEFLLVHDPYDVPKWWNGWVIHGHHHWMKEFPFIDGVHKNINVACELIDYTPIDIEKIILLDFQSIRRMDTINSNPIRW